MMTNKANGGNGGDRDPWKTFGPVVMAQAPYRVIYADPPWETPNRRYGLGGTHYPLMRNTEIFNLPVRGLVGADALLLLWVTWPNLGIMRELIDAWGFTYLTGMPWVKWSKDGKPWISYGVWFRECSELLIVARKGKKITPPQPARTGVVLAPRGKVSAKPEEVPQWIEAVTRGQGPYLELFARRPRPNWVIWGNEVEPG